MPCRASCCSYKDEVIDVSIQASSKLMSQQIRLRSMNELNTKKHNTGPEILCAVSWELLSLDSDINKDCGGARVCLQAKTWMQSTMAQIIR